MSLAFGVMFWSFELVTVVQNKKKKNSHNDTLYNMITML